MSVSVQACTTATIAGFFALSAGLLSAPIRNLSPAAIAQSEPETSQNSRRIESPAGSFQRGQPSSTATDESSNTLEEYQWETIEGDTFSNTGAPSDTGVPSNAGVTGNGVHSGTGEASANNSPVFDLNVGATQEGAGGGGAGIPGEGGSGSNGVQGSGEGDNTDSGQGGTGSGTGSEGGIGNNSGSGNGRGQGQGQGGDGAGNGDGGFAPSLGIEETIPAVTGLIVDARRLDFVPSMSMRLYDPDGNQIYTTLESNRDLNTYQVSSNGTAAFVTTEADAHRLVNRIGDRPTTVTARSTLGYDLVLNNADAWELRQQNERDRFLDNFAVVVIWSP